MFACLSELELQQPKFSVSVRVCTCVRACVSVCVCACMCECARLKTRKVCVLPDCVNVCMGMSVCVHLRERQNLVVDVRLLQTQKVRTNVYNIMCLLTLRY